LLGAYGNARRNGPVVRSATLLILAIFSAPVLYGVVCVPATGFLMAQFPEAINPQGGTHVTALVLGIELLQLATLVTCGAVVELISGRVDPSSRSITVATLLMLSIAIAVQAQYWTALPVWHHGIFFLLILTGMPAGRFWVRR